MRNLGAAVVFLLLAACASSSASGDRNAVIVNPDAKSRLALQNAVSKTLGVAYVVLAEDALTKESTLIIEPARIRDFQGRLLQGRDSRGPERFHLVKGKKKNDCVLVYEHTGTRIPLIDTECKASKS